MFLLYGKKFRVENHVVGEVLRSAINYMRRQREVDGLGLAVAVAMALFHCLVKFVCQIALNCWLTH